MALKYLMDENVTPIYATQLRRKRPDLVVWAVGEIGTPPKSTLDPEIMLGVITIATGKKSIALLFLIIQMIKWIKFKKTSFRLPSLESLHNQQHFVSPESDC